MCAALIFTGHWSPPLFRDILVRRASPSLVDDPSALIRWLLGCDNHVPRAFANFFISHGADYLPGEVSGCPGHLPALHAP
jgi:hypothetical protein